MASDRGDWLSRTLLAVAAGVPVATANLIAANSWWVSAVAASSVTALTWYGHFLASTFIRSHRLQRYRYVFGSIANPFREELKRQDDTARVNVMLVRRDWNFSEHFWFFDNEDLTDHPDEHLRLRADQGVAGKAYSNKKWAIGDLKNNKLFLGTIGTSLADRTEDSVSYGMTTQQMQQTRDLTLIISFPIRRLKQVNGNKLVFANDLIGVVNIDTKRDDALSFYDSPQMKDELLMRRLPSLANVCAAFFS